MIRYEELLELFWRTHQPTRPRGDSQYRSVIFATPAQLGPARRSHSAAEARGQRRLFTQIQPFERFTLAEDNHQKYGLRRVPGVRQELLARFPDFGEFVASTGVTRINGYAGGHGGRAQVVADMPRLGLSASGERELLELV